MFFGVVMAMALGGEPAEGGLRRFHHTRVTDARADAVWAAWMDVEAWPEWDTELQSASSPEPLSLGVTGTLQSGGRTVAFTVTEFEPGASYTYEMPLPLGRLVVRRSLGLQDGRLTFTHDVRLTGFGGWLLGPVLGKRFRAALPTVMQQLEASVQS